MRLFQCLTSTILGLTIWATSTYASSQARDPLNYVSLLENARINTPSSRVNAYSSFELTFDLHQKTEHIRLTLEPNYDILPEDAHVSFVDQHGNIQHAQRFNREDHKVYLGQSYMVDNSGVSMHVGTTRIMIKRDGSHPLFEGFFTIFGNSHHIQLKSNYMATKHRMDPHLADTTDDTMVIWRDSDVGQLSRTDLRSRSAGQLSCASDRLTFNTDPEHPLYRDLLKRGEGRLGVAHVSSLFGKRQDIDGGGYGNGNSGGVNLRDTIGDTRGCPSQRRVALIGVATDCTYAQSFNGNRTAVSDNIVKVVNEASDLFQSTFNITLGLRNLTIQESTCPTTTSTATPWNVACGDSVTITNRLNLFSQWRASQGDTNAYWSLFTECNTATEVGLAWLGQLCNHGGTQQPDGQNGEQTVTGANVIARTANEWQVFAHESGHTFGAVHDCTSSSCNSANTVASSQCCPLSSSQCDANSAYLMNPYSSRGITQFSPCSIGNICSALRRNSVSSTCLQENRGVVTITGSQCGNGIVEDGEDCDCGGADGCAGNTCCNPTTCRYNTNAVCDPSNEGCCTSQCQFASNGTECRASTGACDPAETCPGNAGLCPADDNAEDGTDCGNGLQCASGQCTSRDQQCRTVMGVYTQSNDTAACNSQTCSLSCRSGEFGQGVCYSLQQNFLDGTPCSGGGRCDNGVCRGGGAGGAIRSWVDDNRTLVIVLASVIGGLIVIAILGCVIRACRRPRGKRMPTRARRGVHGTQPPAGSQAWSGPPVPSQMQQRGYGGPSSASGPWQPSPPQQSYSGYGGPSVRYA